MHWLAFVCRPVREIIVSIRIERFVGDLLEETGRISKDNYWKGKSRFSFIARADRR